jgi:Kiwa protein KwaB-like
MTPTAALKSLGGFLEKAPAVNVILTADIDGAGVFQRLRVVKALAEEFRGIARAGLDDVSASETVVREYSAGYKPDSHEILYLRLADEVEVGRVVDDMRRVDQAELFKEDDRVIAGLRMYGVVIQSSAKEHAVFLRGYGPKKELSRSGVLGIVHGRGFYNKLTENVFLFDDRIDCFAWQGYLFILRVASFQRMFRYFEQLRTRAEAALDELTLRVPVANVEEFKTACLGQVQMMAKVTQIVGKPYLGSLTMVDIKRTIETFGLDVEIRLEGGVERLVFDNGPEKRWLLLKLLDDDYLGSVMTEQKYEVNSKIALG